MDIIWKYKIEITDQSVFSELESKYSLTIPEELKAFLVEHNAATPSKTHFMIGSTERIFGAVLSFNREDTDVDTVFTAFDAIEDRSLVPFGIDPFGNYICYALADDQIVFWDHESGNILTTGSGLKRFITQLY